MGLLLGLVDVTLSRGARGVPEDSKQGLRRILGGSTRSAYARTCVLHANNGLPVRSGGSYGVTNDVAVIVWLPLRSIASTSKPY